MPLERLYLFSRSSARMVVWQSAFRTVIASVRPVTRIRPGFVTSKIRPINMKIESQEYSDLFTPELTKLSTLFKDNNFELRIAGGAVRDLLMGIAPADVDFATTATPTQMKELFEREGIRMLHKRGEEHGTITCRIDDAANFEITTLRVDKVCDGRRAEVEYTTDWQLDANRRDLTINSLFLDLDGVVVDYFGGIEDAKKRRVAFVGDPAQRIQEDYLRILRYFRFYGRISDSKVHEKATLEAINTHKGGLATVSPERIWTEFKKIVVGRMAPEVLETMLVECNLVELLGLPDSPNLDRFKEVYRYSPDLEPMTMIAALSSSLEDIARFHKKTKLSNFERTLGEFIIANRDGGLQNATNASWWRNLLVELEAKPGHDSNTTTSRTRVMQLAFSCGLEQSIIDDFKDFIVPHFDLNGTDLMNCGVKKGPVMHNTKLYLFDVWVQSKCQMSKEELLQHAFDEDIPKPVTSSRKRKQE